MTVERKAVIAIVPHNGKILMGKKKDGSEGMMSGKWHIPGETLELGETDEQGLIRGIMEEAGIEVKPGKYVGSHITPKGTIVNWYECEPLSSDITAGSDLEGVMWVPFGEVLVVCHERAISLWPEEVVEYFEE
jgi:8-oxo-dGTP pyrophosphatase MutT (NUDIX family)